METSFLTMKSNINRKEKKRVSSKKKAEEASNIKTWKRMMSLGYILAHMQCRTPAV